MTSDIKRPELDIISLDKSINESVYTNHRIDTELNVCKSLTSVEKYKHSLPRFARFRIIEHLMVIWLDLNRNESNEDTHSSINKLRHIVNSVKIFNNTNKCIDFLTDLKNEKVFIIISNDISQWIIPLIADIPILHAIYIFDSNQTQTEHWKKEHQKVQGVFTLIDDICNTLKRDICKFETDLTLIGIIPRNPIVNLDELDQSFMYSQILKEIIIEIKHDEKFKKEFVHFCRGQYCNNDIQLNLINTFERDYQLHSPIWWYTKEPFIYITLNQALRKQDIEIIIKMAFFLQDLHRQIERIHLENHQMTKMIVYRGQGMANMEFEKMKKNKGGLLSFNQFLSTSIDQDVSLLFASSVRDNPDLTGILFEIEIDPSISSVPYAVLDDVSFYSDLEKEILFSMHTIFRISDIESIEDRLWKVSLTSTSDTDQEMMHLATYIRNEIGETTGWVRMAGLMIKIGKFDKAIEIYNTLLETIANNDDDKKELITSLPAIANNTAVARASLGNYSSALEYLKVILEIMDKVLPSNHSLLARTCNNIGTIYRLGNQFSTALSYYEKANEIIQNSFPIDDTELAVSYRNMGGIHEALGDYSTALTFYEKAHEIDQKFLPSIHPDLAISYFDIGGLHALMGKYTIALSHFEKTLEIDRKSLPPYHSHIASTHRIIADTYQSMGEYSKALLYYEKTIEIEEQSLLFNHPDRATTFNGIGNVYQSLGDYSTALEYFQKSLKIQENLSFNPIDLATTYSNIGLAYESMKDYPIALSYYEKALEFEQNSLPPNHPNLGITYSNIAGLYQLMKDYSTALSYYQKTLEIQQTSLEPNHPDLAITYNDIGLTHQSMEDYSTALKYYEKTLEIQETCLSASHPHLAVTYHNIGDIFVLKEDYSTALSYYDKALHIKEKSLPPIHPTLITLYHNIGEVHFATEQYSTALTFYEKKLEVQLKSSSPDQLDIAGTYSKIARIYKTLEDYVTALSYYKKTLEIQEEQLSSDDLELATTYECISELYIFLKDHLTALSYYEKALEIQQECVSSEDPSLITSFHSMSLLLNKLSRYEEAIAYAERAMNIACHVPEPDHAEIEEIQEHIDDLKQKIQCTQHVN